MRDSSTAVRGIAVYEESGLVVSSCNRLLTFRRRDVPSASLVPFKMKALRVFEMSEDEYTVTQRYVPEGWNSQLHRCGNLRTLTTLYILNKILKLDKHFVCMLYVSHVCFMFRI
jgi:hypothetical protein